MSYASDSSEGASPGTAASTPSLSRTSVWLPLLGIFALAILLRWPLLGAMSTDTMDPDAAHFLNVARCIERGQGFSNPAAWPAWMNPQALPMPESFKEPAYSFLISFLSSPDTFFRTGQYISLLGGLLTPLLVFFLARRLGTDPAVPMVAGLLAAANPLLISRSGWVMVESIFTMWVMLALVLAATRAHAVAWAGRRGLVLEVLLGLTLGIAFMFRAQTVLLLPAIAALLMAGRPARVALRSALLVAACAALAASPFLMRNFATFGEPIHSDVGAFAIWPYVDHLQFSHGLERPPAPLGYMLTHMPQVIAHFASSLVRFGTGTLPLQILGNPLWLVGLAVGVWVAVRGWRRWSFALLYMIPTMLLFLSVHWDARYFVPVVPIWLLITSLGLVRIWRWFTGTTWIVQPKVRALVVVLGCVAVLALLPVTLRAQAPWVRSENHAARVLAKYLASHGDDDFSVMAVTTSYYAWFLDRPVVHLVIGDEAAFAQILSRHDVRWVALPTTRLAELSARYPEGRLPATLERFREFTDADLTLFRVVPHAARLDTSS